MIWYAASGWWSRSSRIFWPRNPWQPLETIAVEVMRGHVTVYNGMVQERRGGQVSVGEDMRIVKWHRGKVGEVRNSPLYVSNNANCNSSSS
jgi:hypothetical protein